MNIPQLKTHFAQGKVLFNILLSSGDPFFAEITGRSGFPSVMIDMQHGLQHADRLLPVLQALPDSVIPLVRIPWNDPAAAMKALDAGAAGVVCPMINNATEAQAFVQACHYPPKGIRSFGPIRAQYLGQQPDYFSSARDHFLTAVMIETAQALEDIDAIAAIEGLDMLYAGPFDLSVSLQRPQRANFQDPVLIAALERILAAARAAGKYTAVFTVNEADARLAIAMGFNMVSYGTDTGLFAKTVQHAIQQLQGFIAQP